MIAYQTSPQTKAIQQYGLEILQTFHEICETHQLNYILDFGTLLGAIRHQGFIPWDDDIDVAMPRKDFEMFQKIAPSALPAHMFLQTHDTDSNYYNLIAKIRIPNTDYVENAMQYFDIVHGPWLDIFIYDAKFDDCELEKQKQKIYNKKRSFYPKLINTLYCDPAVDYNFFEQKSKQIYQKVIQKAQARQKRVLLMRYLDKQYDEVTQIIKENPPSNSSGELLTYTFPIHSKADEAGLSLNQKDFQNRKLQKFEGFLFYIPKNYDQLLTNRYGNYLELPAVADRKSNHQWVHNPPSS